MAEIDSSQIIFRQMMKTRASLAKTKSSIAEVNFAMAYSKAYINALMSQQRANVMKGEIQKAIGKSDF